MEKKSKAAVDIKRRIITKFQTKRPSVMHTKHDCTKRQGRESREKTAWESPCLFVPSSGYKTEIAIEPDSLSFSLESERMGKMGN